VRLKSLLIILLLLITCLSGAAFLAGAGWMWYSARPAPGRAEQVLFHGISYARTERSSPRPMVIHVVTVDLRAEGISFLVTPGDPDQDLPLNARLTSEFLDEFGLQLAINGDGVTPWWSNSVLDYYPHRGDGVDPIGFAASRGQVYSQPTDAEPTLYISRTNRARIGRPQGKTYNAVSGNAVLLQDGSIIAPAGGKAEPRTALALDRRTRRLIMAIVDGRQPNYSEGATLAELAEILLSNGGYNAINLDGGGSSTLVIEDEQGRPRLLNSPIDNQIPGRERPVGNHLGIFARRVSESGSGE
jgi:hypothetical protein